MWYAYDWEFLELGPGYPIEPISVGIVASDGRELYLQNINASFSYIHTMKDPWLRENVLPHLSSFNLTIGHPDLLDYLNSPVLPHSVWRTRAEMAEAIRDFMDPSKHGRVKKLVGYYADYDHVLLAQTFGRMVDLPDWMPKWTYDIKQEINRLKIANIQALVPEDEAEHHALNDARWVARAYTYLRGMDS